MSKNREERLVPVFSSGVLVFGQISDVWEQMDSVELWDHHTVFLAVRTRTIEPTPPTARACGHTDKHEQTDAGVLWQHIMFLETLF